MGIRRISEGALFYFMLCLATNCSKSQKGDCEAVSLYEINCPSSSESSSDNTGGGGSTSGSVSGSSSSGSSSSTSGSSSTGSGSGPTLSSIAPSFGSVAGGDMITISGSSLTSASVEVDGATCTVTVNSSTEVSCRTTNHAQGTVDVSVTTSDGTSTLSDSYVYTPSSAADTSFSIDGHFSISVSGGSDNPRKIRLASGGGVFFAGTETSEGAILKFTSNGVMDSAFGGDGIVTSVYLGSAPHAYGLAVGGSGQPTIMGPHASGMAIERFTTDGNLDTSFNVDGRISVASITGTYFNMEKDSQGKLYIVGQRSDNLEIIRFTSEGIADTAFSVDGIVSRSLSGTKDHLYGVAVDALDRVVAVGVTNNSKLLLVRYTTDGGIDTSFDIDGYNTLNTSSSGVLRDVLIQSDGKIAFTGSLDDHFVIGRYNSNGSGDTSFHQDGILTVDSSGFAEHGYGLAVHSNGKFLFVGSSYTFYALGRVNTNGTLDTSFSGDGLFTGSIGTGDAIVSVAIYSNGLIMTGAKVDGRFLVRRVLP